MRRAWLAGILGAGMAGCGHEYALSSLGELVPMGSSELAIEEAEPMPGGQPGPDGGPDDLALSTPELNPNGLQPGAIEPELPIAEPIPDDLQVTLGGETRAQVADYLFVVDGSSSMQRLLGNVLDGFEALAGSSVFPEEARIAVMNTMPADPARRDRPHPAAPPIGWLRFEPGFGELVNGRRIAMFREVAPARVAERFAHNGCSAWFSPDDRNDDGVPCLVANTQLALYPMQVEAGLLALHQRIQSDKPLFRSGAVVNVVIVSDTHDPGVPAEHPYFAELLQQRPTFADIERSALRRQDLASFRLHAVAPAEVCAAEDWSAAGPSYFEAAHASGGEILDVCDATPDEYIELVRRIATKGAIPQRPVIALSQPVGGAQVAQIEQVLVGGVPTDYQVSHDGRAVVLKGELPKDAQDVVVRFRRPRAEASNPALVEDPALADDPSEATAAAE